MSLRDLSPGNVGVRFLLGVCLIVLAVLPFGLRILDRDQASPRTLVEAATAAEARGLYWRSIAEDGSLRTSAIVVSTQPVTWERANSIRVNHPNNPCWHGTIVVYTCGRQLSMNADPSMSMVWGELFLYGDPRVIEKLTGRHLPSNRAKDHEDSR
jgi:hypothetical protein